MIWRWLKQQWCGLVRGHYAVVKDRFPYYHTVYFILWCYACQADLGEVCITKEEMTRLLGEEES